MVKNNFNQSKNNKNIEKNYRYFNKVGPLSNNVRKKWWRFRNALGLYHVQKHLFDPKNLIWINFLDLNWTPLFHFPLLLLVLFSFGWCKWWLQVNMSDEEENLRSAGRRGPIFALQGLQILPTGIEVPKVGQENGLRFRRTILWQPVWNA